MPDIVQQASTGRAKCRACREPIAKGEFRFGEQVANSFGDGDTLQWFHMGCAADRRPEKLKAAIEAYEGDIADRAALIATVDQGIANAELRFVSGLEKAPSGRATCQECHSKIEKGVWRVAIDRSPDGVTPMGGSVHLACATAHFGAIGLNERLMRAAANLGPDERAEALDALTALGFE